MTELKPCPFCGGKVNISYDIELEPNGIWCPTCHSFMKYPNIKAKSKKETFGETIAKFEAAWNRRHNE